jgi:UDP-N-acetylmuramyl tripeptide synthase
MKAPLAPTLALARSLGALSRLRGGGGTSAPGKLLVRLDSGAIGALAARLPQGSVVVSATNGKTTTAAFIAGILTRHGTSLVHNRAGANMAGGIASTLLGAARARGAIHGELGLFEVDEYWLGDLVSQLRPRAILLGNLFRDQLDRYGELESIAERWASTLAADPAREAQLVLNADDPMVADLGRAREDDGGHAHGSRGRESETDTGGASVLYYGVDDDSLSLAGMAHAADAKHCRRCGALYVFDAVYLGHLGHYRCPSCGQARPVPSVIATDVVLEGVRSARFTLRTPAGDAEVHLALPGLYNVYNALAAAALATALDVPLPTIVAGLQATAPAFGRAESVTVAGRELRILLVKNPAGANEVLRTLALEPGAHDLLGVLNDNTADGRDVSWIWDADFELLKGRLRRVTCAGTRAAELALRLKYAGVDPARIQVQDDLATALDLAAADRPASAPVELHAAAERLAGADADTPPLYALPTYTAMLSLRQLLVSRGEARSAWS